MTRQGALFPQARRQADCVTVGLAIPRLITVCAERGVVEPPAYVFIGKKPAAVLLEEAHC